MESKKVFLPVMFLLFGMTAFACGPKEEEAEEVTKNVSKMT